MVDERDVLTGGADTEMTPDGPHGTGDSGARGGEDVASEESESGRYDTEQQGETGRPAGKSTMRDSTSIDPQEPIDDDSPTLPPA